MTPLPAYSSVCKLCHWYTFCISQLTEADDLTLIPSLGRPVRDAMLGTIPTIAELAVTNPEAFINGKKTIFPRLGADRLRLFHARATMLKGTPPKAYLRAPVALRVAPVELFFDIEVDPLRGICYLHGFVERVDENNGTERFIYFFAPEVSNEAEHNAFAQAYAYLSQQETAAIYYYSKYERTQYRNLQEKYPDVCSAEDIEALFDSARAIDLLWRRGHQGD
jgi:predicted RecB family nuclease